MLNFLYPSLHPPLLMLSVFLPMLGCISIVGTFPEAWNAIMVSGGCCPIPNVIRSRQSQKSCFLTKCFVVCIAGMCQPSRNECYSMSVCYCECCVPVFSSVFVCVWGGGRLCVCVGGCGGSVFVHALDFSPTYTY